MTQAVIRQIEENFPCLQCRYNLRGLMTDNVCPECGLAVRSSVVDPIGEWPEKTFQSFAAGLTWLSKGMDRFGIVLLLLFSIGMFYATWYEMRGLSDHRFASGYAIIAGPPVFFLLCIWPWQRMRACRRLCDYPGRVPKSHDRWAGVYAALVPNLVIGGGAVLFYLFVLFPEQLVSTGVFVLLTLLSIGAGMAWFAHLRWLATELRTVVTAGAGFDAKSCDAAVHQLLTTRRLMTGVKWFLLAVDLGVCVIFLFVKSGYGLPVFWLFLLSVSQLSLSADAAKIRGLLFHARSRPNAPVGEAPPTSPTGPPHAA